MTVNNLAIQQSNDWQVVRGDALIMKWEFPNFVPAGFGMQLDIIDPFTKEVIVMGNNSNSYSKYWANSQALGGIYFFDDTNIPYAFGASLTKNNQVFVILDIADTDRLEANIGYNYQIAVLKNGLKQTVIRGVINVLARALDV